MRATTEVSATRQQDTSCVLLLGVDPFVGRARELQLLAMQEGDLASLLAAAEECEVASRGVGLEEQLEAELALAVALRLNGRVREAITYAPYASGAYYSRPHRSTAMDAFCRSLFGSPERQRR